MAFESASERPARGSIGSHARASPLWRQRVFATASVLATVVLAGVLVVLAPFSVWNPFMVGAVAALAMCSLLTTVTLRARSITYYPADIPVLLGLVLLGPLPGALLTVPSTALESSYWKHRDFASYLANVSSWAWGVVGAYGVLLLGGIGIGQMNLSLAGYAVLFAAGLAMITVNYLASTLLFKVIRDGERLMPLAEREFFPAIPNHLAIFALAALTLFLYTLIGIPALALFALIVYVPQLMLPRLLGGRELTKMSRGKATASVGLAIAHKLGVAPRAEQEIKWRALGLDKRRQRQAKRKLRRLEAKRRAAIQEIQRELQQELLGWDDHIASVQEVQSWSIRFAMRNIYEADRQRAVSSTGRGCKP